MKILSKDTKYAHLGKPGSTFSKGFQRRLEKVTQKIDIRDKKILDQGCGEGVWLRAFSNFTEPINIFGSDIDAESIQDLKKQNKDLSIPDTNLKVCPAEKLDFQSSIFDIVFSNEVLEHVDDDILAVEEVYRVLKAGGDFVIFTPNRLWPFETHGIFWRGKYIWGNIPFVPWLPNFLYKKLAPHVRNYSDGRLKKLFPKNKWEVVHHSHIFPGFDGAVRRWGVIGKSIQKFFHLLEKTPLQIFGISHFLIVRKKKL
jgi:ubiquinone/menaquinone biosynthesis C-methylase UbiE